MERQTTYFSCTDRTFVEQGPKPFSPQTAVLADREVASMTSLETDADVSSFLDQALLEEDLKNTTNGIVESLANGVPPKDSVQSPENFYNQTEVC